MFHVSPRPYLHDFSAPKSSPLAARDPNVCPRFSIQVAAARKVGDENSLYSYQRAHNPLFQRKASEEQDHRRRVFLKKIKKAGDDTKWESRSERILRQEFLARQKQWETEQARSAPDAPSSPEEEEQDVESSPMQEVEMVKILSQEDQGIEELVSLMQHAEDDREEENRDYAKSDYGSDEDEYDQLFMEVLLEREMVVGQLGQAAEASSQRDHYHEMDMSLG